MKVLVTGASGFVGSALIEKLIAEDIELLAVARDAAKISADIACIGVKNIDANTSWQDINAGCDVVVHCAARVHVMDDISRDPLSEFRAVNTEGTLNFARQAAEAGVKRFVFISSIKVSGEATALNHPYESTDLPEPSDPYGISKYEAEQGLKLLAKETAMEVVIIRPVLVYGPGVKANFLTMMKWLSRGVPLPLGAIHNKRSLVALDNLVDLIVTCVDHPNAANNIFLVSDDHDVSTTELLLLLGKALAKKPVLIPVPMRLISLCCRIVGRDDISQRLCGSLQVDIKHTKATLGWSPPYSLEQSLQKTVNAFRQKNKA